MIAIRAKKVEIVLSRLMAVHIQVHCGCNKHWSLHRQISGNEHIISYSVSHLAKTACRTGGYEHSVGPQPEVNMRVPSAVALREELANHGLVSQRTQCYWSYKLLSGRRNDNLNFGTTLYQSANNEAGLVGGNAARYT